MPIFRIQDKLGYFAHVPKCGGTAVEAFLRRNFGPPAFLDNAFNTVPASEKWSATSPQHVDARTLGRLFPAGFFDLCFAVVRDPGDRLKSIFLFQRDIEGRIAPDATFPAWLRSLARERETDPFCYDNHPRPMADLVPETATVFRLEDGLDRIPGWLESQAPGAVTEPRVPRRNDLRKRLDALGKPFRQVELRGQDRALVSSLYRTDFERFGYDPDPMPN